MKVSVCITTHNLEKYICQTIDSVLKQKTSFNFEILIGDDYSTDGTRAILLEYQKKYPEKIKLHFQKENVGVNRQDYDLINMAKGEYIAWLDGDDWWITEDKLEKQARILDAHPKYSCVHTSWIDYYNDTHTCVKVKHPQEWESRIKGVEYVEKFLLKETCGCRFSSIMMRSSIIKNYLLTDPESFLSVPHLQNDFMIFCILSYYGPFYYLKDITTSYRIIDNSLSHNTTSQNSYKYNLAYIYAVAHIIKSFRVSKNVKQSCFSKLVSGILPDIIKNNKIDDLDKIISISKSINYRLSFKQWLIINIAHKSILRFFLSKFS